MLTFPSYKEFVHDVDDVINNTVTSKHKQSWNENHITYSLIDRFCYRYARVQVHGLRDSLACTWEAFKLKGYAEQAFGDLAVLISLRTQSTPFFVGVGLIEAKLRYFPSGRFEAANRTQLQRLNEQAPLLKLMLYDWSVSDAHTDNTIAADTLATAPVIYKKSASGNTLVVPTCTYCIAASAALSQRRISTDLYPFGITLGTQICSRYMRGFDLHIDPKIVRKCLGHSGGLGARYLLIITLDSTGQLGPHNDCPRPNLDLFERVEAVG